MERLSSLITRHPRAVVAAWLILTIAFGAGTLKLTSKNNYEGDLPLSDPTVAEQARFEEAFGDEQMMLVAIESPDLLGDEALEKTALLTADLRSLTGVKEGGVAGLSTIPVRPFDPTSPTVLDVLSGSRREQREGLLDALPQAAGFLSADRRTTLITAQVSRTAPQSEVAAQVKSIVERYEGPERVHVIGDHTVAQAIDEGIESDLGLLLPLAFLLILVVLRICFGRVRSALLPACVMIGSIVWTLGLMGHLGIPLNVVTSTLPILMVAVASSYGIHVVRQAASLESRTDRVRALLMDLGQPILLTGLTSAAGALSLLVFEVQSIREFGLFAGFGILSATVVALLFMPAALALSKNTKARLTTSERFDNWLSALGRFTLAHRHAVLGALIVVIVASAVGIARIRIGMDPVSMFPTDHPVREATAVLTEQFDGCRYFDVMVDGGKPGSGLEPNTLEAIRLFADGARHLPDVTAVYSVSDLVPPGVPTPALIPGLRAAGFIDNEAQRGRVTVMIAATDQADQTRVYDQLRAVAETHLDEGYVVSFGGPVLRWIAQNRYVSIGKVLSVIAALAFVFVACVTAFRSVRTGVLASTPLIVSTVTTFGVMGWMGIRLNMATAITTAIGLGIGVDFGIHFLSRLRQELESSDLEDSVVQTILTTGRAVIYDVGSNVVGFGVLVFSVFGPVQDFGWLISLTMVTSAAGTLVILPAAAAWLLPGDTRPLAVGGFNEILGSCVRKSRALMILNREAAAGRSDAEVAEVVASFERHFSFVDRKVAVVETHAEATVAARSFRSSCEGFGAIVAGGGAGTLRAVAEGLCADTGRPPDPDRLCVAPLRLGSGNVLAKTFGVSEDFEQAIAAAAINVRRSAIDECAVIRCAVDGQVRYAMTLVGLGQFGRIPGDLAVLHQAYPRAREGLVDALGVERLTNLEYKAGMLIRGARCWVRPSRMEEVEIQTHRGTTDIRLLAGAVANFPIKGLPFRPTHGPGAPVLSGYLLRGESASPLKALRQASAYRFKVSENEPIVIRLKSPEPVEFFLDEDSLTFQNELQIGVSGTLGIVPGNEERPSTHHLVRDENLASEVEHDHARMYSGH